MDVGDVFGVMEEWSYLTVVETGDATSDACDEEDVFGMMPCEIDKIVDVWLDGLYPTLHGGNSIRLSLQSDALPPDGSKLVDCGTCSASSMVLLASRIFLYRRYRKRNTTVRIIMRNIEAKISTPKRAFDMIFSFFHFFIFSF